MSKHFKVTTDRGVEIDSNVGIPCPICHKPMHLTSGEITPHGGRLWFECYSCDTHVDTPFSSITTIID